MIHARSAPTHLSRRLLDHRRPARGKHPAAPLPLSLLTLRSVLHLWALEARLSLLALSATTWTGKHSTLTGDIHKPMTRNCKFCKTSFTGHGNKRYCSKRCKRGAYWQQLTPKEKRKRANASPKRRRVYIRKYRLRTRYGLSLGTYNKMLVAQEGVCAICRFPETAHRKGTIVEFAVDHDHSTGRVRGLLCRSCNLGLGRFKDSPRLLLAALEYLARPAISG